MKQLITLHVNGESCQVLAEPFHTLSDVLRDGLGLTGTKKGCGRGNCGACTVLMEGKAVNSCLILAVDAQGRRITTIEGLSRLLAVEGRRPELAEGQGHLHPLQEVFIRYGAVQCGFCTPGMLLSAAALLEENPVPTEAEVRAALEGNLCRCTGYQKIAEAVLSLSSASLPSISARS